MLTAVVFVPTPPLLVPELTGQATPATRDLRAACLSAVRALADVSLSWTAVAAGATDQQLTPQAAGTWQPFGVDLAVSLGPGTAARTARVDLPLPALVAGWLRERGAPDAAIHLQLYDHETPPARCTELGRALAADPRAAALLVLGDGCTTLSAKAPGAYDERAAAVQQQIDTALSTVDRSALTNLDPTLCAELGVSGRVPWHIAAAAAGGGWRGRSLYGGAPYGVGYQVAMWQR